MVLGLNKFKEHFAAYADRYVLIGGTASSLAMEELGQEFRATKDLDIVLIVEALDSNFAHAFWDFVRAGAYENRQKSTGKRLFYRFYAPRTEGFPVMIELFSRVPDAIEVSPKSDLTPVPIGDDASSLSAILMDDVYYRFVHEHRRDYDGLTSLGAEALIPLKARAYVDLSDRKASGEKIDSRNVKKHKSDIFRLFTTLDPTKQISLTGRMVSDMNECIDRLEREEVDLKALGIRSGTLPEIIIELKRLYGL